MVSFMFSDTPLATGLYAEWIKERELIPIPKILLILTYLILIEIVIKLFSQSFKPMGVA